MTNEQFKVTFSANNQLSAVLTQITNELDQTYQTAGKTTKAMQSLSKSFTSTAGMNKFSQNMLAVQNSLNTLSGTLNVSKLNNAATAVTNIANALQALSKITGPKSVISSLRSLSNLSVNKLSSSMQKLAVSSGAVARNLNSIAKSMAKLNAMGALNAKMKITTPTTGTAGTGTGGTGTGTGGTAAATSKAAKPMTAWQTFEKTLHVFNSLTFAVGTAQIAFQKFFDLIDKGNQLTKAQTLLMGISQTKGLLLGTSAAQRYSEAIGVAAKNQVLFGGSFSESINGILKLQQIATSAGVSVEELNNVVQLLSMRDPVQGIEGATIAIQELMSGDPMSLRRRFELPSDEVNVLANAAGDAKGQIAGLTALLATQGITADVLAGQLDTTAAAYARLGAVTSFATETTGQSFAAMFAGATDELAKFVAQSLYGYGAMDTSVGKFGDALASVYMGPMAAFIGKIPLMAYEASDMKFAFREANREIFDSWIQLGIIHDPYRVKEMEKAKYGIASYTEYVSEMTQVQMRANDVIMQTALVTSGLGESIGDLISQLNQQNQVSRRDLLLEAALIKSKTDFAGAVSVTAKVLSITEEEASRLIKTLQTSKEFEAGGGGFRGIAAALFGIEWPEEEVKETAAATRTLADETERLNEIYEETQRRLVEFDKEIYRKRIREMQAYYADATLLQQKRAYEMRANDLDLVEGKNKKLDAADRQRLLARENIEAYGQLQMNQAVARANEYALQGNAKFAKEYLAIQEERISDGEKLYQQLHDTQVRLEGDPEAQQRAKQVYDDAIKLQEEYYTTRVGLADAAARQEREEEASQRRQIIDDAIQSVMQLENVDESRRQAIIQGLEIAKTTITDLSNTYVDKVDAMRGSLDLLANALARVRNESNILTPDQLAAFNGLGIGQITAPPGGSIDVNQTTVNVGGINISVQSQVDPAQIRTIVLDVLQKQLNQRG
jgi:hypothetical protein